MLHPVRSHYREEAAEAAIAADMQGRVLFWNPASERLFGYSSAEAVGMQLADLLGGIMPQPGNADALDIEVTESLLMQDLQENLAKLDAVRRLGIGIALDDFGTGYSSLAYLARLPVNVLKVAQAASRYHQ